MLSFACSFASLSQFPSHYLPCQIQLPEFATADYLLDKGQPIHAVFGTYSSPWHFPSHTPIRGTERHCPPQMVRDYTSVLCGSNIIISPMPHLKERRVTNATIRVLFVPVEALLPKCPIQYKLSRHRGDSNPCGQSPMDFESISLTARTQCLACAGAIP